MKNHLINPLTWLCLVTGLLCMQQTHAQGRLVLNDNAFLVISNGASLVIDNSSPDALQTEGSGGNIISEGENNEVKWNIGSATGTYVVPFTTLPAVQGGDEVKIPLSVNITQAGSSDGNLVFATYKTNNSNAPYPSDVTNMLSDAVGGDGSLYAIDRFWIVDAGAYTTKPDVDMSFGYDDGNSELGGSNLLSESGLQAQRFNFLMDDWQGTLFGSVNTSANTVSGVTVGPADFFRSWTLVDFAFPLPVSLTEFTGVCSNNQLQFHWSTASELNNNYFDLQKSEDGLEWKSLARIDGAGNSASPRNYSWQTAGDGNFAYYRLQQTDFNNRSRYSKVISAGCNGSGEVLVVNYDGQAGIQFRNQPGLYNIQLINQGGQVVMQEQAPVGEGESFHAIQQGQLPDQIYLLKITRGNYILTKKVLLNRD